MSRPSVLKRNVVEEEDRSRNVVIFGLNKEDNEKLWQMKLYEVISCNQMQQDIKGFR